VKTRGAIDAVVIAEGDGRVAERRCPLDEIFG
jgi:hypothetical protein